MLESTVSKSFYKSINTAQTDCLLSSDFLISSISLIVSFEIFFENQTVSGIKQYVHLEIAFFFRA